MSTPKQTTERGNEQRPDSPREANHPGESLASRQERIAEKDSLLEQTQAQLLQSGKLAVIGQLAAGVAHEINNPLGFVTSNMNTLRGYLRPISSVLGAYAELLADCESGPSALQGRAEGVRRVVEAADLDYLFEDLNDLVRECSDGLDRIQRIVADLRDLSHTGTPDSAEEDLHALLDKSINIASHELKYKAEVIREYGNLPPLTCHGMQLAQCFINLLVNAAHAIPKFGTITVRTGLDSGQLWVEIEDSGEGMSEETCSRIFEPFFTTKDVGRGTGLGLPLARKTVESHGGEIRVRSTLGTGTVFRVNLPQGGVVGSQEQESSDRVTRIDPAPAEA